MGTKQKWIRLGKMKFYFFIREISMFVGYEKAIMVNVFGNSLYKCSGV